MIIQSGNIGQKHDYILINSDQSTWWCKFDYDRVTPVTDQEVLEGSYGRELEPPRDTAPQTVSSLVFT